MTLLFQTANSEFIQHSYCLKNYFTCHLLTSIVSVCYWKTWAKPQKSGNLYYQYLESDHLVASHIDTFGVRAVSCLVLPVMSTENWSVVAEQGGADTPGLCLR